MPGWLPAAAKNESVGEKLGFVLLTAGKLWSGAEAAGIGWLETADQIPRLPSIVPPSTISRAIFLFLLYIPIFLLRPDGFC